MYESILPEWAPWGSRFAENWINSLWLNAKQYEHISLPYNARTDARGNPVTMWDKRPSVRLNLPSLGGRISSRKLFVGKHAPKFDHDNQAMQDAIKWISEQSNLFWNGLDAALNGQAGSVGITLKIVDEVPVMDVVPGKNCYPTFDDAKRLVKFQTAWLITGAQWLGLNSGTELDCNGEPVNPSSQYWFIRMWDTKGLVTLHPIPQDEWNPEDNDDSDKKKFVETLSQVHNLGFVPVVWIRNMPNTNHTDGPSSFGLALSNCAHIDYTLSQFGKGFNYMGSPQLFIRGKIISRNGAGGHTFSSESFLQMPADYKDANGVSTSNADAKLIEMQGDGMKVGMELWIEKVKHWTLESMSLSRKDVNSIKGTMSGTAIMLLDEDFYDYVEGMKVPYGTYGVLAVIKMFLKMFIFQKHDKVSGLTEKEVDIVSLDWPRMYEPEPTELKALVEALAGSVTAGFMETEEGSDILAAAVDKELTWTEPEKNDLLAKPGIPDPVAPGAAKPKPKTGKTSKKKTAPKV